MSNLQKKHLVIFSFLILSIVFGGVFYFTQNTGDETYTPSPSPASATTSETGTDTEHSVSLSATLYDAEGNSRDVQIEAVPIEKANAMYIKFLSLNRDLSLTKEPWMDFDKFDSDLNQLEAQEKARLSEQKSNWTQIIASDDLRSSMLAFIQESISVAQSDKQKILEEVGIFRGALQKGTNIEKKNILTQLDSVGTDLLLLYDFQIEIKNKTLTAVQVRSVDSSIQASNDEDRISLVLYWHTVQLNNLLAQYAAVSEPL